MAKNPVIIVDYTPEWQSWFERLSRVIGQALGDAVLRIEHVGSTSVPGLAAKPIIDLDVVIDSYDDLPVMIDGLAKLGYFHEGDLGIEGREAFDRTDKNVPRDGNGTVWPEHHLYVCPKDSPALANHIAFRDHLRAHPEDAAAYAEVKKDLAVKFSDDRPSYTEAKTEFITGILAKTIE